MKKKDLIKNYKSKIKNLKFHNDLYFNKDNPEISDQELENASGGTFIEGIGAAAALGGAIAITLNLCDQ